MSLKNGACQSLGGWRELLFERISLSSTDILHQKMTETCASAHIGGVNIVLLEGITPDIQYVFLRFSLAVG